MRDRLLACLDEIGPADMREIVIALRESARVIMPHLDRLIAIDHVYTYTDDDYARDSGEAIRYPAPVLYGIKRT